MTEVVIHCYIPCGCLILKHNDNLLDKVNNKQPVIQTLMEGTHFNRPFRFDNGVLSTFVAVVHACKKNIINWK